MCDDNTHLPPANVPKALNSVSIFQYSPYAGDKMVVRKRARTWEELNPIPAVDGPLDSQNGNRNADGNRNTDDNEIQTTTEI
jgi:hypothetical protein